MDADLRYRTELADQLLTRLAPLGERQWRDIVQLHTEADGYYALALELAEEATRLLGDGRRGAHEASLAERLTHVDVLLEARALGDAERAAARRLARAALHACLVRDAQGFNSGAFGALLRPFRAHLNVGELERRASRARTPSDGGPPVAPDPAGGAR